MTIMIIIVIIIKNENQIKYQRIMKRLFFISGTMEVGKTTVCNALKEKLNNCVFFRRRLVLEFQSFYRK